MRLAAVSVLVLLDLGLAALEKLTRRDPDAKTQAWLDERNVTLYWTDGTN